MKINLANKIAFMYLKLFNVIELTSENLKKDNVDSLHEKYPYLLNG